MQLHQEIIQLIRREQPPLDNGFIDLHKPTFSNTEETYVLEALRSGVVSTVGEYVSKFEKDIAKYTGVKHAIATSSGTSALHLSLVSAGVQPGDEVVTQSFTFAATAAAISYCSARPIFLDIDKENLGLSPLSLRAFLEEQTFQKEGRCFNKNTGNRISACVPMHSFGLPCKALELSLICKEHNLLLIEDSAQATGSFKAEKHSGTIGSMGVLSFNGNKVITAGGGGCILTNDDILARKAKHLSTTAKVNHVWEYFHDDIGYNYRMTNLNAALIGAQLENIEKLIESKRNLAVRYQKELNALGVQTIQEEENCRSNYWLNCIVFDSKKDSLDFLNLSNSENVMTRPSWTPLHLLPMYKNCIQDDLKNTRFFSDRIVSIPSSAQLESGPI